MHPLANLKLLHSTAILISLTIIGWLLVIGRDLLIPLILAIIIWYLINTISRSIERVHIGSITISRTFSLAISIILMVLSTVLVLELVTQNVIALTDDAAIYQANLEKKLTSILHAIAPNTSINLDKFNSSVNIPSLVSRASSALGNTISILGLIIIYLLFLLLEQVTFDSKFIALFNDEKKAKRAIKVRNEIAQRISKYLSIKTLVSLLTGFLSYLFLELVGVNYAIFWGFIIFLLNYIPTIGSMLGVIFPAALSLVQFDTSWQFFTIIILLGSLQFAIGNILEPRLMGNSLNLSGLAIMLALSFWGSIWGVTGMILSVPITVVILIICSQFPSSRPIAILLSNEGKI